MKWIFTYFFICLPFYSGDSTDSDTALIWTTDFKAELARRQAIRRHEAKTREEATIDRLKEIIAGGADEERDTEDQDA